MPRLSRVVVTAAVSITLAVGIGALLPAAAYAAGPTTITAATTASAITTSAAASTTTVSTPEPSADAPHTKTCHLATTLDTMLQRFVSRASGSATVRGSVAWLQARSSRARQAGHDAVADRLASLATTRSRRLTAVKDLQPRLAAAITAYCDHP